MADEEQQVPQQTQPSEPTQPDTTTTTKTTTQEEDSSRGQSSEAQDDPQPKTTATEEPKAEQQPSREAAKSAQESPRKSATEDEPSKPEKEETEKKEEEEKEEGTQKEEPKKKEEEKAEAVKTEPQKSEPQKTEGSKKPEGKREEQRPYKPEPKKEQARKYDGRGRGDDTASEGGRRGMARNKFDSRSMPEKEKSDVSENRPQRQKVEFVKEELKRLQDNLKREASKIVPPRRREYKPFIFNTLEPYYNTHTTSFLVDKPAEAEQQLAGFTFSSRSTSLGLIDPWIDLRMDHEILPQISSRPTTRSDMKSRGKGKGKKSSEPSRKEGSTRLPKFPVVAIETKDLVSKQLYYSDVPTLRKELKSKYSAQARSRQETDYRRTQQDFYRMDLDRLDQVPEGNRQHLTSTYLAYLNTPGSRRALNDCVRTLNVQGKAH